MGPEPPPADPRMLRGTIGPGAARLVYELELDRSVIDAFAANGQPDYVWAPSPSQLVLLFLSADKAVELTGPVGARRPVRAVSPIPDDWLDMTAPDDRDEVRARRLPGGAKARSARPGWCAVAGEPSPLAGCLQNATASARWRELRRRVDVRWHPPSVDHGGERVIVRFRIDPSGALADRCVFGATSPAAAQTVLEAFDAAFPVAPLTGDAACLAAPLLEARFEIETN